MKTLISTALIVLLPTLSFGQENPQMRLADPLDFPNEGYCIDVPGVGPSARIDLPLVMHNCLPSLPRVDRQAVEKDGRILFPAYNACVTAFGAFAPLPGAAVILRPCGARESFLNAANLQMFERTKDNQLRLTGTQLCLTAGPDAARTFSASDRWRTLTIELCSKADPALSVWAQ